MTAEYLKQVKQQGDKSDNGNQQEDNNEKVFIVYKVIQTPVEALEAGM
jgi:hypothetical protein